MRNSRPAVEGKKPIAARFQLRPDPLAH